VASEFEEIGHSGGKITFRIGIGPKGERVYQVEISGDRPVPAAWIALWVLPPGVPVDAIQLGGVGHPWNPQYSKLFRGIHRLR
jgi:hypothetical protein